MDSISDSMDVNLSQLWEIVKDREAWHAVVHGVTKSWTQLSNWTTSAFDETTHRNEQAVWEGWGCFYKNTSLDPSPDSLHRWEGKTGGLETLRNKGIVSLGSWMCSPSKTCQVGRWRWVALLHFSVKEKVALKTIMCTSKGEFNYIHTKLTHCIPSLKYQGTS